MIEKSAQRAVFEFIAPRDLLYFDGHFPGRPILPGVVQVDWVIAFGRECFDLPPFFRAIHALKFHRVIPPETPIHARARSSTGEVILIFQDHLSISAPMRAAECCLERRMFNPCVVIPVYNHEQAIGAVVQGVLAQKLPCIVVDDGSGHECAGVLDALAAAAPEKIILIRHPVNRGKGSAVLTRRSLRGAGGL